jgi:DNA-binding NarL/FixJ family response regulator
MLSEALEHFRVLGDRRGIAGALQDLGIVALDTADFAHAEHLLQQSLAIWRDERHVYSTGRNLVDLARLARYQRSFADAERMLNEAEEFGRSDSDDTLIADAGIERGWLALAAGDATLAASRFDATLSICVRLGMLAHCAACFEGMAHVAASIDRAPEAIHMLAAATALRGSVEYALPAVEAPAHEQLARALRDRVSDDSWAEAWEAGRSMSIDAASHYARQITVPVAADRVSDTSGTPAVLSRRELEVLRLVADGQTNQEIAASLFISPNTVTNHVTNILNKLGLDSRTAAATYAVRHGLI